MSVSIPTYHIDAFTDRLFCGNPAAVCVLKEELPETTLLSIAAENNLAATVFLWPHAENYHIRWFAPEYEIDLCGHGTLAAGFVIFNFLNPDRKKMTLEHHKAGMLTIMRRGDEIILEFPLKSLEPIAPLPFLEMGLGKKPKELYQHQKERILAVFDTEDDIQQIQPNIEPLKTFEHRGIIVTAPGKNCDFVSRVFYPQKQIFEDAATGSSFCLLAPYWEKQLNKKQFKARQLSKRGAIVECEIKDPLLYLSGRAVLFKQGETLLKQNP